MLSITISTPLPAVIRRTPAARPSVVRSITSLKPSSRALAAFAALPAVEITLAAPCARALVAEYQRRLGPRVSARQNRVIERRDAGGREPDQYPSVRHRRFWNLHQLQILVAAESFCSHCTHDVYSFHREVLSRPAVS